MLDPEKFSNFYDKYVQEGLQAVAGPLYGQPPQTIERGEAHWTTLPFAADQRSQYAMILAYSPVGLAEHVSRNDAHSLRLQGRDVHNQFYQQTDASEIWPANISEPHCTFLARVGRMTADVRLVAIGNDDQGGAACYPFPVHFLGVVNPNIAANYLDLENTPGIFGSAYPL